MHEFERIAQLFAPLAVGFPGALGLRDDAATLTLPVNEELVVTTDTIVSGVHFLGSEDPKLIAQKALRVNLSDLAAKGAQPLCYFLSAQLPPAWDDAQLARFCLGLGEDQKHYGIHLAGGDSVKSETLAFSITALGTTPKALLRSGAREGDALYVSGTLGDGALGLLCVREGEDVAALAQRYFLPEPRVALGISLREIASACMDLSDGLLQDAGHLCAASNVGAVLYERALPRSAAAHAMITQHPERAELVYNGGDDYELLFAVPPEKEALLAEYDVTRIGTCTFERDVCLLDASGMEITPAHLGYRHV